MPMSLRSLLLECAPMKRDVEMGRREIRVGVQPEGETL